MGKENGFTLIELLAIIVILAIIAVITVPIILGIIDDAKLNASVDSAYGFKDAVDKYYVSKTITNDSLKLDGTYSVSNGRINGFTMNDAEISISGTKPSGGSLTYVNNILVSGCLVIDGYEVNYVDNQFLTNGKGNCKILKLVSDNDKNGSVSFGDEYRVKGESFYVINVESEKVTLFAKYNLNYGKSVYNCCPSVSEIIANPTGLQDVNSSNDYMVEYVTGSVKFADTDYFNPYWKSTDKYYPDVYTNEKNADGTYIASIAEYVENYKSYLQLEGLNVENARLLTYTEAITKMGCDSETQKCPTGSDKFVTNTAYWLGTASSDNSGTMYLIQKNGNISNVAASVDGYCGDVYGVRPVIEVPLSDIQ